MPSINSNPAVLTMAPLPTAEFLYGVVSPSAEKLKIT